MRSWNQTITVASVILAIGTSALQAAHRSRERVLGGPRDEMALVYFIRPPGIGMGRTVFLYADQEFLGVVDGKSYTFSYVTPGPRLLWLNFSNVTIRWEFEAGKTYYFSLANLTFVPLGEEIASMAMNRTKSYSTPTERERRTAAKHISERFHEAQQAAALQAREVVSERHDKIISAWPPVDLSGYSILVIEDFDITDPEPKMWNYAGAEVRIPDALQEEVLPGLFEEVRRGSLMASLPGAAIVRARLDRYKAAQCTFWSFESLLGFQLWVLDGVDEKALASISGQRASYESNILQEGLADSCSMDQLEAELVYQLGIYLARSKGREIPAAAAGN